MSERSTADRVVSSRRPARLTSPKLVGRSRELDRLAGHVARQPAFVVVEGPAGIGKTRLLAELRDRPELERRRLLVGGCRQIREPYPLGPVVDALRRLDTDPGATELPPVTGALHSLLPELGDLLPPRLEPLAERRAERHRTFRGLTELLGSLGPTVLAIEDVHWIDEHTIDFLRYLLAKPPADLTVLLTFRGEDVPSGVRALTSTPTLSVSQLHLVLEPLDVDDTGALAAALLDVDEVSAEFGRYLRERTSGLPFAIQELLALLGARGTLVRRGPSWARKALDELDVPSEIRDQVLERVGGLTDDGRTVSEAAATLQLPVPLSTLVETARSSDDQSLRGIDDALQAGLLVENQKLLAFRHLLAAQVVYESIPLKRRKDLHRRAANALEKLWPVPLGQVAHHRREAGQAEAWVVAAERAADQAIEAGDDAEAARLLEQLIRHTPLDSEQRTRIAVKLGRVALEAQRPADLIAPLSEALEHDGEMPQAARGKLHFWLGLLLHQTGHDPERQVSLFAAAVEELDDQPALRASAMICLALGSSPSDSIPLTWARRASEILPEVDDPAYEVVLQSKVSAVMVTAGDPQWREAADRIIAQTGGEPQDRHEVRAYSTIGGCAVWAGHHELAADWLSRAVTAQEIRDDEPLAPRLRTNQAVLDFFRGEWNGLGDRIDEYLEQYAERPRIRIDLNAVGSRLALAEGDTDAATRRLDELLVGIEKLEAYDMIPMAVDIRIRLALAHDDSAAAAEAADQLREASAATDIWPGAARALPSTTEALVAAGRADDAAAWLTTMEKDLADLDVPLAAAALDHARGLLAGPDQQWELAAEHFAAAAASYDALHCPYEAALAREQVAEVRFAGDLPDADRWLHEAAVSYQDLGAGSDLDRAAGLALEHDVSLPARHRGGRRGYGTELSPREREVAELAATGLTNKEIAEKLFVSVNTVKKQVSAAMRKVGVHSRTALSDQLGED